MVFMFSSQKKIHFELRKSTARCKANYWLNTDHVFEPCRSENPSQSQICIAVKERTRFISPALLSCTAT